MTFQTKEEAELYLKRNCFIQLITLNHFYLANHKCALYAYVRKVPRVNGFYIYVKKIVYSQKYSCSFIKTFSFLHKTTDDFSDFIKKWS